MTSLAEDVGAVLPLQLPQQLLMRLVNCCRKLTSVGLKLRELLLEKNPSWKLPSAEQESWAEAGSATLAFEEANFVTAEKLSKT
jgi:hypothetical protein